jgi:hypothetical protein
VVVLGLVPPFLFLAPSAARACSCSGEPSDPDAVFVGTVVGEEGYVPGSPRVTWVLWTFFRVSFEGHRYRVRAKTSWLGLKQPDVVVVTGLGSGDCGTPVEVGKSYLFRTGREPQGEQGMAACGLRPEPVDLSTFDEATVPLIPGGEVIHWPPLPPRPSPLRWLPLVAGMVAVLSTLGWIGVRRLRSHRADTASSTKSPAP